MAEAARKSKDKYIVTPDTYRAHKIPISDYSLQMLQQMYHEAWQYRMFRDPVLREISNYINTDMSEWYLRSDPARSGRQPNTGVMLYDRTAIKSSNLCAEGIMGYAISRQDVWFRMEFDDERQNDSALSFRGL